MTLTWRSLRVRPVELPLERPIQTAVGEIRTSALALLDLTTEEGVTGTTYVFCVSREGLAGVVAVLEALAPTLRGTDIAPAALRDALRRRFRILGAGGLIGLALGGIDMAAWDALARAAGLPLVELLGGRAGTRVPAYASIKSMRPNDAAQEAAGWLPNGFRHFKLKIGSGTLEDDVAVIAAVREVVGDGAALMVDYNQSLTVAEAERRIRRLEREGLAWIEEPVHAEDIAGHARLAATFDTPIQAGESWWSPEEAQRAITARSSDFVMPDVARIGGVTGWMHAAAIAAAANVPISSHVYPEVSAHLLAATPGAHLLEHLDKTRPLLAPELIVRDGHVTVPATPGSGVAFDEAVVARLTA